MAKKQTKKVEVNDQYQEEDVAVMTAPIKKLKSSPEDGWVIKDRVYNLKHGLSPLTYTIGSCDMYWFDEDKGYEREIRYTRNQKTVFVDEFKGKVQPAHITFVDGVLHVPKNKVTLQKFLSIYHKDLGRRYTEHKPEIIAIDEVAKIELEIEALNTAKSLDIDMAEAVMRVEIGSRVSKMSSKELKRDLLLFAKRNPSLFLELASDDNVALRNVGVRANEMGIIKLSSDQRTFSWGSNDRKLMTVPFDEHPYSALAQWFKTDEGMEIYSSIEKRLK